MRRDDRWQVRARKVTRDVDFHGCPMKKDDMVLLTIQAATRDPRQFPDPEQVQIDPVSQYFDVAIWPGESSGAVR